MATGAPLSLHGTAVALAGAGVLLRGPSGAGKSDLALRLIEGAGVLISDDVVHVTQREARLWLAPPASIAGRLEVRGVGVVACPFMGEAPLVLLLDLVAPASLERLPQPAVETILGVEVPRFALAPFEASAVAKVRALLGALRHDGFRHDIAR